MCESHADAAASMQRSTDLGEGIWMWLTSMYANTLLIIIVIVHCNGDWPSDVQRDSTCNGNVHFWWFRLMNKSAFMPPRAQKIIVKQLEVKNTANRPIDVATRGTLQSMSLSTLKHWRWNQNRLRVNKSLFFLTLTLHKIHHNACDKKY